MDLATIKIKNLRLKTIIGVNDWERESKQDVVINIQLTFDPEEAINTDSLEHTIDYYELEKSIIKFVENSSYYLVEKLTAKIIHLIMKNQRVLEVKVSAAKPDAMERSDSVSIELTKKRDI